MKELIVKVKRKDKIPFIKELLHHLPFVEVIERDSKKLSYQKKKNLKDLDESVEFVAKYNKGKVKAKSFNELLNEL